MKPILNIADAAQSRALANGDFFDVKMAPLAELIGGKKIGANVTTVPPGKAAFPLHHHYANEEHFFILRGNGVLRFGSESYPVKPGDYIVAPGGGPEHAHQLINTGSEDLARHLHPDLARSGRLSGYRQDRCGGGAVRRARPGAFPGRRR
jgi:uncharacterized cupin superfamily protein